jgi:uncharacterized membrane protein YdbT with pleckstrin-like domain
MSSYVQKILMPDERVVYAATLHWIIYLQGLFFVIAGGLFGSVLPYGINRFLGDDAGAKMTRPLALMGFGLILVGAVLLLGAWIRQNATELVVTDHRVIAKYGFVSRATFELMIGRVTGANFDQTVLGRCLGYGTIIVRGAGGDISPIDNVADPQGFHNAVMATFERADGRKPPAQATPPR